MKESGHQPDVHAPGRLRRVLVRSWVFWLVLGLAACFALVWFIAWWAVLGLAEPQSWPPSPSAVTAAGAQQATASFAANPDATVADLGMKFAWSTAATVDPVVEGSDFYPRMLDDIDAARDSVHLIQYGFRPGKVGDQFEAALTAALGRGVQVRLVVDGYGSDPDGASKSMYERLANAGAQIVENDVLPPGRTGLWPDRTRDWSTRQLGHYEHRKLLVVDGRVAWVGGAGIEDHFANGAFHDVMVRVTGDIVHQFQAVFLTTFHAHGGPLPTGDAALARYFPQPEEPGDLTAIVVGTTHRRDVSALHATRDMIDHAKKRIDIANPYFTDDDLVDRIIAASRRGVRVRVLVHSNSAIHANALRDDYARLIDAGVQIWEYPDAVVHCKVLVADDSVMFGTVNLDAWALYRAYEVAAIVKDPATVQLFEQRLFEPDIALSIAAKAPSSLSDRLKCWFSDKLSYFL